MIHTDRQIIYEWLNETHAHTHNGTHPDNPSFGITHRVVWNVHTHNGTHPDNPSFGITHRVVWNVLSYIHFQKDIVYKKVPLNFALGSAADMFLKN
jgi:hypothetical protein